MEIPQLDPHVDVRKARICLWKVVWKGYPNPNIFHRNAWFFSMFFFCCHPAGRALSFYLQVGGSELRSSKFGGGFFALDLSMFFEEDGWDTLRFLNIFACWWLSGDASFLDQLEIDLNHVDVEIGAGKTCVTLDLVNVGILTLDLFGSTLELRNHRPWSSREFWRIKLPRFLTETRSRFDVPGGGTHSMWGAKLCLFPHGSFLRYCWWFKDPSDH